MRARVAGTAVFAAVVLASCAGPTGGPIKNDELERGVLSLSSTAGAGQLLTVGVIEDRTKTTVVRVNARDLSEEATHEAEKLQDADANPDLRAKKSEAVAIAQGIAAALSDLQVAPTDADVAREVGKRLDTLDHRATQLAGRI